MVDQKGADKVTSLVVATTNSRDGSTLTHNGGGGVGGVELELGTAAPANRERVGPRHTCGRGKVGLAGRAKSPMGQHKVIPLLPPRRRQESLAAGAGPVVAVARQPLFTGQRRTNPLAAAAVVLAPSVVMEGLKVAQTERGCPPGVAETQLSLSAVLVLLEEETSAS